MNISSSKQEGFYFSQNLKSQIIELDKLHFPFPWNLKQWENLFDRDENYMTFSISDEFLRGFSLFEINNYEQMAHLYKICVDPAHRENNIAKDLLKKSFTYFKELKLETVFLEVAVDNNAAVSLYEGLGFEKLNQIKKFYSDGTDAFAMQKRL
jgi:ribosomal-protein-alanine N-acetyltransferase